MMLLRSTFSLRLVPLDQQSFDTSKDRGYVDNRSIFVGNVGYVACRQNFLQVPSLYPCRILKLISLAEGCQVFSCHQPQALPEPKISLRRALVLLHHWGDTWKSRVQWGILLSKLFGTYCFSISQNLVPLANHSQGRKLLRHSGKISSPESASEAVDRAVVIDPVAELVE